MSGDLTHLDLIADLHALAALDDRARLAVQTSREDDWR